MSSEGDKVQHARTSRRVLVRGAAWSLPAVAVASVAPAYAASPCEFEWRTQISILSGGESNQIARDKHEPTGTGDCSDLSADYWIEKTEYKGSEYVAGPGETLYRYVPHFRVIIGTQIDLTDVRVVLQTGHPVVADTLTPPVSPAAGATPDIYKINKVDDLPTPVVSDDGKEVRWGIPSMPAQSSAQYQINGAEYVMTEAEAEAYRYTMSLTASGTRDCGSVPVQCPPPVG